MKRSSTIRSFLVVIAAAAVLTLAASPASAGSRSVNDPSDAPAGKGDVRKVTVVNGNANVVITITTEQGLDIETAPPWDDEDSVSEINIPIDTGGSVQPEFRVEIEPTSAGALATVVRLSDRVERCYPFLTQPAATPGNSKIRVRFEVDCVGTPANLRAFVRYDLDVAGNGSVDSVDRGPNSGYTPPVPRG